MRQLLAGPLPKPALSTDLISRCPLLYTGRMSFMAFLPPGCGRGGGGGGGGSRGLGPGRGPAWAGRHCPWAGSTGPMKGRAGHRVGGSGMGSKTHPKGQRSPRHHRPSSEGNGGTAAGRNGSDAGIVGGGGGCSHAPTNALRRRGPSAHCCGRPPEPPAPARHAPCRSQSARDPDSSAPWNSALALPAG